LAQAGERGLHGGLALGVERAGGFVEQQDARIAQQGAGERDTLPLAAGEAAATGSDGRVETLRQGVDEIGGGGMGGALDLEVGGAGSSNSSASWPT